MKLNKIWAFGAALSLVAGVAFAQGFGGGGGRGFGGGGPLQIVMITEVQKELKIDEVQVDLLKQLSAEFQPKYRELFQGFRPGGGGGGDREAIQAKMQALSADESKKVAEILDAKQMSRVKQLQLQRAGSMALFQPEIQTALKITPEQKTKLQGVQTEQREAMMQMFQSFQGQQPTPEQRQEIGKKMEDMRTQGDTKMLAVLTSDQKKQFDGMKGAPFTFPQFQRRPQQ